MSLDLHGCLCLCQSGGGGRATFSSTVTKLGRNVGDQTWQVGWGRVWAEPKGIGFRGNRCAAMATKKMWFFRSGQPSEPYQTSQDKGVVQVENLT